MKKIRIWWLNPVVLYTMLMLLVLFANNMSSIKYSSLFGMKKGIEFKYLLRIRISLCFVCARISVI